MLRKIRVFLAVLSITFITLLFVDFTGTAHRWLGWMAKIQFMPALLALNVGVLLMLVVATLVLGRVYCSVICPLGIMQDIFARFGRMRRKYRYNYSPALTWLRVMMLGVMTAAVITGIHVIVALLAPYSAYGRIAQNFLSPVWGWLNNCLAYGAERLDSYAFYGVDVWLRSGITLGVAAVTLVVLGWLSWRNGRTYCNTVCPVGTVLGTISRFSLFRPVIDTAKCNACGLCARNCKSACIDPKAHKIDYSRCVACMDCIDTCRHGAISYTFRRTKVAPAPDATPATDSSRRTFLVATATIGAAAALKAQEKTVDGGLAAITAKKCPERRTSIVPAGAQGLKNVDSHCTACQLCVAACPNGVLRPSGSAVRLMQPEAGYERGYCRPECTRCSEVCPTGAILPVTREQKTAIQVGHAVWVAANCVPLTDGHECGNCARHCPAGAIQMVASDPHDENSVKIPVVNDSRCIGCGACENLCPARPFSAIYVEGLERHNSI